MNQKIPIGVDLDPTLGYERNSRIRDIFNFFLIPILNILPGSLRGLVKKTHQLAGEIIDKATSHEALEILYKEGEPHKTRNIIQSLFYYIWFTTNNPKAIRNRLRLVTRELSNELSRKFKDRKGVRLLSIASGSARAVVDSLQKTTQKEIRCSTLFLDKNEKAHQYGKDLLRKKNFPPNYNFNWVGDTASNFPKYYKEKEELDIIEMVGLLDYFVDKKIEEIFSLIYQNLSLEGVLITANIRDNAERPFLTNLVGWKMIYREPEDFYRMAFKAGFKKENIKILIEPMKIHFVMIARK